MADSSSSNDDFLQHITTTLNACSVETLPNPFKLEENSTKSVWPLMVGCYELDESSGQRRGCLDLYSVPVPNNDEEDLVSLGTPINVLRGTSSGVLDGKWYQRQSELFYATAHASGQVVIHKVVENVGSLENPLTASQVGNTQERESALCLALSWDLNNPDQDFTRIVSTYSNGQVAIHRVVFRDDTGQLLEQERFDAHRMFQSPAEVWSACFTTNSNVLLTGGDEGCLKIWDLRAGTTQAMHVLKNHFEAGVTVLSPHPRKDHLVACGSYDETIALLDLRSVSSERPRQLYHSQPLGGGIWRMKWHPLDDDRLLLGAMHGGCLVVKVDYGGEKQQCHLTIQQKFTNHQSMAYGADWLVFQRPGIEERIEAAVSCSFYDRAMYMWKTN